MAEEQEEKVELHMSAEEISATSNYESDFVKGIDAALLAETLVGQWRKTARVIAFVVRSYPRVPTSFLLERLILFVKDGQLEHQGNIRLIRFSEVRRPIQ